MTSVYGVTFIGARDQIMRRLKDRGAISDSKQLFTAACYAAKVRGKNFVFAVINLELLLMCNALGYDKVFLNASFLKFDSG